MTAAAHCGHRARRSSRSRQDHRTVSPQGRGTALSVIDDVKLALEEVEENLTKPATCLSLPHCGYDPAAAALGS